MRMPWQVTAKDIVDLFFTPSSGKSAKELEQEINEFEDWQRQANRVEPIVERCKTLD